MQGSTDCQFDIVVGKNNSDGMFEKISLAILIYMITYNDSKKNCHIWNVCRSPSLELRRLHIDLI